MAADVAAAPPGSAWSVAATGALAVMAGLGFGLRLSYTAAGFLATANLAGYLAGSLVSGAIMRRLGPRMTATSALGVLAVSLAWMGAARGVVDASLARALAGGAGAVVYVQALGLIAAWFPGPARGLASGIMHSGNGLGLVLTGLGLPVVVATAANGWRAGWLLLAVAALIIAPLAWLYLWAPGRVGTGVRKPLRPFFAEILRGLGLPLAKSGLVWAVVGPLSLGSGAFAGALSDSSAPRPGAFPRSWPRP